MEFFEKVKLYDWVPFFRELSSALVIIGQNQEERNSILKSKALSVFGSDHVLSKHDFIDPFSFIYALAQKNNVNKRQEIYEQVRTSFGVTASIPSDTVFPSPSNNAKVCFYTNGDYIDRDGLNIDIAVLWETFDQAFQGNISSENFEKMISLKGVRITKFSQVLFLINPDTFWSIDENSLWLPIFSESSENLKNSVEHEGINRFLTLLATVRNTFPNCKFYEMNLLCWLLSGEEPQLKVTGNYCQISSKLDGPDGKDYFDDFVEQNSVWTGGEGKHVGGYAVNKVKDGDIVLVRRGTRALGGIGIIIQNEFEEGVYDEEKAIHIIWLNKQPKKLNYGLGDWKGFNERVTGDTYNKFHDQYKDTFDLIEKIIAKQNGQPYIDTPHTITINADLMTSLNTILYGPPGTGKTYNTIRRAAEIVTGESYNGRYEEAKELYKKYFGSQIEFITFHQNYSYEDFVAGLRPDISADTNGLKFKEHRGIFYKICERAKKNFLEHQQYKQGKQFKDPTFEEVLNEFLKPLIENDEPIQLSTIARNKSFKIFSVNAKNLGFEKQSGSREHTLSINTLKGLYEGNREYDLQGLGVYMYPVVDKLKQIAATIKKPLTEVALKNHVLIIDEINRANISRVFGELITLLELDKRLGSKHELQLHLPGLPDEEAFGVPPNLYIIGTMNTADKSIALLDIALRRRFHFEPMYPDAMLPGVQYGDILTKINEQVLVKKGADFLIGHSYFMPDEYGVFDLQKSMNYKVIPLLNEYFYSQKGDTVKSIIEIAIAAYPVMKIDKDLYGQLQFSVS